MLHTTTENIDRQLLDISLQVPECEVCLMMICKHNNSLFVLEEELFVPHDLLVLALTGRGAGILDSVTQCKQCNSYSIEYRIQQS